MENKIRFEDGPRWIQGNAPLCSLCSKRVRGKVYFDGDKPAHRRCMLEKKLRAALAEKES